MVFTTEGLLEVAIESWPEWDLNPRPIATSNNPSVVNTICITSFRYKRDYLCETSLKNKCGD